MARRVRRRASRWVASRRGSGSRGASTSHRGHRGGTGSRGLRRREAPLQPSFRRHASIGRRLLRERGGRLAHDPLGTAEQGADRSTQRWSQLRGVLDDAGSRDRRVEAGLDHRQRDVRDGRDRRRGAADGRLPRARSPGPDDSRRVVSFGRHRGPRPGRGSGVRRPQARSHLRQPPELHHGDRGRRRQTVQRAAKPGTCSGPAVAAVAGISASPHGLRSRLTR